MGAKLKKLGSGSLAKQPRFGLNWSSQISTVWSPLRVLLGGSIETMFIVTVVCFPVNLSRFWLAWLRFRPIFWTFRSIFPTFTAISERTAFITTPQDRGVLVRPSPNQPATWLSPMTSTFVSRPFLRYTTWKLRILILNKSTFNNKFRLQFSSSTALALCDANSSS